MVSASWLSITLGLSCLVQGAPSANGSGCSARTFSSLRLSNIEVTSLNVTAAENYPTTGAADDGSAPVGVTSASTGSTASTVDMCLITITYTHPGQYDNINTYIALPLHKKDWNSRFLMDGGGGWVAGGLDQVLSPVASGYTSASTDGGHNSTASTADWGLTSEGNTNWPALKDFASVALAEAAVLGKMATEMYFGSTPKYSYWNGCSTGGRQGHMMAQRYPNLFDGIVGGAPAINWDKFIPSEYWAQLMAQLLDTQPPVCLLQAFTDAAIEACDLLDGVKDQIISLPGKCQFSASSLIGHKVHCNDPKGIITITKEMATLIDAFWQGPRSVDGRFEWYGFGHDADISAILNSTCSSIHSCTAAPFSISTDWIQVFLARNSTFDVNTLTHRDYDRLFEQSINEYASIIGTESPDLTQMKLAGTKMISWHGMQDQLIPTNGTVDYYKRVTEFDPDVADYYRFFLAPGVEHCGGGLGFDPSDTIFAILRDWVENGTAPERLEARATAIQGSNSSSTRTAYLCPYPKIFTYTGGDPNSASSFDCV